MTPDEKIKKLGNDLFAMSQRVRIANNRYDDMKQKHQAVQRANSQLYSTIQNLKKIIYPCKKCGGLGYIDDAERCKACNGFNVAKFKEMYRNV